MPRVVKVVVPDDVEESEVARWIAEGLSRKILRRLVLESLSKGMELDLESALMEFEKTRDETWKKIEQEYKERDLI